MESTFLLNSIALSPRPFSGNFHSRRRGLIGRIPASRRDANYNHNHNGRLVDESMIVLRRRIHELKEAESNEEEAAPSHWMEWERRYYAKYDSDVCEAVGLLQSKLMETRPSLALTMAVVILLSIPTSAAMILVQLVGAIKG